MKSIFTTRDDLDLAGFFGNLKGLCRGYNSTGLNEVINKSAPRHTLCDVVHQMFVQSP